MMRSIKRILMHACLITSLVVGAGNGIVVAQEQAQEPAAISQDTGQATASVSGQEEALIKKNLFTVTPLVEVELKQEDVVPVSLQFAATPNTAEPLDLTGITANGFTRVVSVDGNSIAQVVVTRLLKGEDFVDLRSDSFTSQFAVDSERLVPTTSVSVDGDEAEFVRAVAQLNGNEEDAAEEETTKADKVVDDSSSVKESGSSDNPIAGGFETPERQEAEDEEERTPNITFNVTTEGCEPIIDLANEIVQQTSKSETLEDGIVSETDACSPNGTVWPIKRNYSACEYSVDIVGGYATAQYMSYYNDDRGARFDLSSCQPDNERRYSIREVEGSCERKVDLDAGLVTVYTQQVYEDSSNSKVIAVACSPSATTYKIERNYDACSYDVDTALGYATAQYMSYYTDDRGGRFDLSSCQPDTSRRFAIQEIEGSCERKVDLAAGEVTVFTQKVYQDENNSQIVAVECAPSSKTYEIERDYSVCTYNVDVEAGYATAQYMSIYRDDKGARFDLASCQPDSERRYAITEVEGSCERQVDLAAGSVTVFKQKVYRDADKAEVLVVECSPSDQMYSIERDYSACSYDIDLVSEKATPQFASFYRDNSGARYDLAGCQPATEQAIDMVEDTDSCKPVADLEEETLNVLAKLTYRNAANQVVPVSDCQPTEEVVQLQRDFALCDDVVDLKKMSAFPQYRLFYKTDEEEMVSFEGCKMDEEQALPITESENTCGLDFDFEKGLAIPNAQLIYTNLADAEVMARDCAPATTIAPIKMTADTSNCTIQHDFAAGQSVQMMMWTYLKGGAAYQATPCITTDTTYTHKKVYQKNGKDVCTAIVNLAKNQVAMQYRTEITVNGQDQIIASCQPDENVIGITTTTDGCTDPAQFQHDMSAGVSYGRERSYYNGTSGRVYVSECQTGSIRYLHSLEPSGWKYDDATLKAWPLVNVSIRPSGNLYVIAQDYLQAGTTALGYALISTEDIPDLQLRTWDGCRELVPSKRVGTYVRPDGSTYLKPLGQGAVIDNGDKCVREKEMMVKNAHQIDLTVSAAKVAFFDGNRRTIEFDPGLWWTKEFTEIGNGPYSGVWFGAPNDDGKACKYATSDYFFERTKITYPTGATGFTDWVNTAITRSNYAPCPGV